MRNLFVCHTQAQLILACGLTLGRFKKCENHLVLFQDFLLRDELHERLDRIFEKTLYLQGIYPKHLDSFTNKLKKYPEYNRKMCELMVMPYDKIFVVCDTIYPEMRAMQIAYGMNKNTDFCWLEDGIIAYYQNVIIRGGLDSNSILRFIRKFYFKYIKGVGKFYNRDFRSFGGTKCIRYAYCLFPNVVREPYKSQRQLVEITRNEYLSGLSAMYVKRELSIKAGDIILLMDKIDTYIYPDKVKESVRTFIAKNLAQGKRIFCKFHPRESESWSVFDGCECLENTVGIESIYLSLVDKAQNITVVGVKSTGIMSAKMLGFNTISLFPHCGEKNPELISFFKAINIQLF